MAADVSSLVRVLNRYKYDRTVGSDSVGGKSTSLITQDLLGGCGDGGFESVKNNYGVLLDLDSDLKVPTGWEKHLDLKLGKVYLQRCNSSSSTSSSDHKQQTNQTVTKLPDLNFPPSPLKPLLNLFNETNLDLKLVSCSSSPPPPQSSSNYQNVCTLNKVKFALERANKEPNYKKRSTTLWNNNNAIPLSLSYSSSSSSIKDMKKNEEIEERILLSPITDGCPECLCCRCNSMVPMPEMKKPKSLQAGYGYYFHIHTFFE